MFEADSQKNIFEKEMGRGTIFKDRDIISPHYTPKQLPFREAQLNEMSSALSVALEGKKPNNLFIYGKTGCIIGDSFVYTGKGWKKIKEVNDKTDTVLTFNKDTKKYDWSNFTFLKFENKDKLLKICLDNGYELTVTKDHPLLTHAMSWKKADELNLGENIVIGYDLPNINVKEISLCLARVLGFTLSDGSLNRKQKRTKDSKGYYYNADRQRFRYFSTDENLLRQVQEDLMQLFKGKPSIVYPKNRCQHVNVISHEICQALNNLGIPFGAKSKIIEIPNLILESSPVIQREFLKALFSGDGTVSQQTYQMEYYSNSKKFLQQISYILHQEGILCKIRHKTAKVNGKTFDSYRLYINGHENLAKFYYKIGFYSAIKQERLKKILEKYVKKIAIAEKNHSTSKIVKIEESFEEFVYDLTVPKNHNFIANGIISHNTGKTSCTKFVLGQLFEFASKNDSKIASTYINCRTHNSKYKVLIKALKDFAPEGNFLGYSASFVYEKILEEVQKDSKHIILALDEIDKVKDLDDLIYSLTRGNDELSAGSISLIGISNNLMFKDRLDSRTKSALCEQEMVFSPYDATELKAILEQRISAAFKEGAVEESAINLAAAIAAQETGDARTAIMLMQRAGELADKEGKQKVTDEEVKNAKSKVEEEIIMNMILTLPEQQQVVLYSIANMTVTKKGLRTISGEEDGVLFSGEIYDEYKRVAKKLRETIVSTRWYREYISELEMFGLILSTVSGKGIRGQTRLIKLGFDANKIKGALEKELFKTS